MPDRSAAIGTPRWWHRRADGLAGLAVLVALIFPLAPGQEASAAKQAEAESAPASTWIARANEAMLPGDTMVARVRSIVDDGLGGERVRLFDMARRTEGDASRTLIEVEAPEATEGVTYEVVIRPDAPNERWVWLPSVGRLIRIVGIHRTDSFLGTDFTYEDLALAFPSERGEGTVRRVVDEGKTMIEVESGPYHYYGRVVTRIDPETHLPTTVRFYDTAGQLFREEEFGQVKTIDGHPFPTEITLRDHETGALSILRFESVQFDVDIPEARFSASALRRRIDERRELISGTRATQ